MDASHAKLTCTRPGQSLVRLPVVDLWGFGQGVWHVKQHVQHAQPQPAHHTVLRLSGLQYDQQRPCVDTLATDCALLLVTTLLDTA